MNERIEHCLYQAGLTAQGCWDEFDDYAKQGIEKFAELIVKECIAQIQEQSPPKITNESHQKLVDAAYNSAVNIGVAKIKQHFGVEE